MSAKADKAASPVTEGFRVRSRSIAARVGFEGAVTTAAFAAVALLPLFGGDDQYLLEVLIQIGLFILLGFGLNIVVALAGLLDLGYIAFWAVGAYTAAILYSPQFHIHLPFLLILPLALVVTSVFAVVIGVPTLRLRGDYLAIVTLGFGEMVRISLLNGQPLTGGSIGIQGIYRPALGGYSFSYFLEPYYYLVFALCIVAMLVGNRVRSSRLGLVWQALRDDELAARSSGIRPLTSYLLAFGMGAAFAGVSGVVFATEQLAVSPDSFVVTESFVVLSIVVLGGMTGRFIPVAISAVAVVGLPELLRAFAQYRLVAFGPLLILIIIGREHRQMIAGRITGVLRGVVGRTGK